MAIYLVFGMIGAIWAAILASNKNLNPVGYAIAGFLMPLIGVLLAYGAAARPAAPDPTV